MVFRDGSLLRCLIIGYGSIGARHAAVFERLGNCVAVATGRRLNLTYPCFHDIGEALRDFGPDLVVVANTTDAHHTTCLVLEDNGFTGVALVEKPLFTVMPEKVFSPDYTAYVGYNLRFHPAVAKLRKLLEGRRIYSAQLSVGQYLPQWRPGSDYRAGYSAHREKGGGVLRDLSHELDLALWLFGKCEKVIAAVGRLGELEIDSEDTADIVLQCCGCPSVNIHMDYQNLFPRRFIAVQASGLSVEADLIASVVKTQVVEERVIIERDTTYIAQAEALMRDDTGMLCSWAEGCDVVACIEAIEKASAAAGWKGKT